MYINNLDLVVVWSISRFMKPAKQVGSDGRFQNCVLIFVGGSPSVFISSSCIVHLMRFDYIFLFTLAETSPKCIVSSQ